MKLLPSHLHGLKVKLSDLAVTAEEFNLLIYEAFILPEGREELFCENEPGCVKGFEATIELVDPSPWYARLRPTAQEDKVLFEEVLNATWREVNREGYGRNELCHRYAGKESFWTQIGLRLQRTT